MTTVTRREFAAVTTLALTAKSYSQIRGANERMRVGAIGCGGQAMDHFRNLAKIKDSDNVDVLSVCDIYDKRAEQGSKATGGKKVHDHRRPPARQNILHRV